MIFLQKKTCATFEVSPAQSWRLKQRSPNFSPSGISAEEGVVQASLFPPGIATGEAVPTVISNTGLCLHPNGGLFTQTLAEARHAWVLPCFRWFSPQKCWSSDKQSQRQSPRAWEVTVSLGLTTSHPVSVGKGSSLLFLVGFGEMKATP